MSLTHVDWDLSRNGSRFWISADDLSCHPYGQDTVGIVDDYQGGIILYCHALLASEIIDAIRAKTRN